MKIDLVSDVAAVLTFQEYPAGEQIEGVFYKPIKKFRSLEGSFMEYLRISDRRVEGVCVDFEPRQISFSHTVAHRINAFHVHPKEVQNEVWCVAQGSMMVWLVDVRKASTTAGKKRKYFLDAEEPGLLYIPSGVAHGYKAGNFGALLVYAADNQFDPKNPNEGRIPWNYFGEKLWEEDRG